MSNEWYTPSKYIEAARQVMGSIDLDPASCELANQTVRAARYYTQEDNGLAQEWIARNVWLNPPYGKLHNRSFIEAWSRKAIREYEARNIQQCILLVQANPDTAWFQLLWDYPLCFCDHHIMFHRPGRNNEAQILGTVFAYLGLNERRFTEVFSKFGRIAKAVDVPVAKPRQLELVS